MRSSILLIACFICVGAYSQRVDWNKIKRFNPDAYLLKAERQPTKVLLLGSFHFGYPNLDGHKTDSSKYIDVMSAKRQQEMSELVEVIKQFKPTRIYIEWYNKARIDSLYKEYRNNRFKLGRNEIYQLGFRIASEMNHSKLYTVDEQPFSHANRNKYVWIDSLWSSRIPVDSLRDQYWDARYKEFYTASDSAELSLSMLEIFLFLSQPAIQNRSHGHYLVSGFNTVSHQGPDALALWWYNRNLRIFNSILKTRPTSEERIIVLFGNGHMPILKHCFQASPEFEVVELRSLLEN